MNLPYISNVEFEETEDRLKVIMPLHRSWPYFSIYSILLLVWVAVTFWLLGLLFRQPIFSMALLNIIIYIVLLLLWAYIWYRLGKHVMRYWQYYAASREILFLDGKSLIVRRPMSIFGVTDAFDMAHVGMFQYGEKEGAIVFDYGSRGGMFGSGLEREEADQLITTLNERYFRQSQENDGYDIFT